MAIGGLEIHNSLQAHKSSHNYHLEVSLVVSYDSTLPIQQSDQQKDLLIEIHSYCQIHQKYKTLLH